MEQQAGVDDVKPPIDTSTNVSFADIIEEQEEVRQNSAYDADMPLEEREAKWGFTLTELQAATKVVRTLFYNPSLYVGDSYLSDSRLYTMITRDRQTKRENRDVMKAIMAEEKSRRKRYQRLRNVEALRRTVMKREREDALKALLLPSEERPAFPLLLCESATQPKKTEDGDDEWSPEERETLRLIGAFENLLRLEQAYAGTLHEKEKEGHGSGDAAMKGFPAGTSGGTGEVDSVLISQLIAQIYRYVPHIFGTQMPPPIFSDVSRSKNSGASEHGQKDRQHRHFTFFVSTYKVEVARRAVQLVQLPVPRKRGPRLEEHEHPHATAELHPVSLSSAIRQTDSDVIVRSPLDTLHSIEGLRGLIKRSCGHDDLNDGSSSNNNVNVSGCDRDIDEMAVVETAGDVLRGVEVVLLEDGTADSRFAAAHAPQPPLSQNGKGEEEEDKTREASGGFTARYVAAQTLNLLIARRLYRKAKLLAAGVSPLVVQRVPPTSTSDEPDSYCVFQDAQLYGVEHHEDDASLLRTTPVACHICKVRYTRLHPYYYSMCHLCGEYNYNKRLMTRDLRGRVVLLTGCRIKIGYAMSLSLLRCGAVLLGTTRFAHEALARFQQESDYDAWKDRLHLFSLDLRDMWLVTQFCAFVTLKYKKLFAIINNAAQTIARTPQYTEHLRAIEINPPAVLRKGLQADSVPAEWHNFFLTHTSVMVGQSLSIEYHPLQKPFLPTVNAAEVEEEEHQGQQHSQNGNTTSTKAHATEETLDADVGDTSTMLAIATTNGIATHVVADRTVVFDRYDTQAEGSDHRETNSWVMKLAEVQGSEAAEVMAINALSPFIINSKLKVCLLNREGDADPKEPRFIINVSAMEGQFYRFKQTTHPHTNMAKAALNMMTRTSGEDYAQDGIYMNSVDTGWITDESPKIKKERRADQYMLCPLDEVDAAARCLDMIYTNSCEHSKFYKDFKEIVW